MRIASAAIRARCNNVNENGSVGHVNELVYYGFKSSKAKNIRVRAELKKEINQGETKPSSQKRCRIVEVLKPCKHILAVSNTYISGREYVETLQTYLGGIIYIVMIGDSLRL